ncbi:AGAP011225-PA-like protein [Anopheles sinensis]|uniref:AGAP011225-PA-like protein n=1 Tax=Anopheles sinensis TaxID=74873 RepID=A0A084VT02_ANOSI|nr:AGAP011225-PA-like protein [Anopheles sinensis]
MALGGFEMQLLMTKLEFLQEKLQEVEQTMQTTIEKTDAKFEKMMEAVENSLQMATNKIKQRLQEKLTKHEKNINEKFEMMDTKFEKQMYAMDSLNKSVKTSEENTMTNFEEVKKQLNSRMDHLQLQLTAETKTIQEKAQTELKQLAENKKSLDMLTDSVRNISTLSEKRKKILEAQFINPVRSCRQVMKLSGRYLIHVEENSKAFEVFCEQNKFDGGWIVIQHRFDGSTDFYRNWTEYRNGFGKLDREFWLGLEYVHQLTKHNPHELLVEIKDFHGHYEYAKYNMFEIGSETEMYALNELGTYSGTAENSMQDNKNFKFSTFDRDNDKDKGNCAKDRRGAWWYNWCSRSNLNGRYQNTIGDPRAMVWEYFKNDWRGLSYSRMMIRDIIH